MAIPNDSISQIETYINLFRTQYEKFPTRAIINDESFSLLEDNAMLISNPSITDKASYTGYVLSNESKIQFLPVHLLEKLPEKERLKLEEKVKDIKYSIIFANKKNHYIFGDLSLCGKELTELKEEAKINQ